MQQVLGQMVELVMSLVQTVAGNGNGLSGVGLGIGGVGLSAAILDKMMAGPESRSSLAQMGVTLPEAERDLKMAKGYNPTDADFAGWRKELETKLKASMDENGLSPKEQELFRQRASGLAVKIDRTARRFPDLVERNMAVSNLIEKELKEIREVAKEQQAPDAKRNGIIEKLELGGGRGHDVSLSGGMVDGQSYVSGQVQSNAIPVWIPTASLERLNDSQHELDRMHTVEQQMQKVEPKIEANNLEEGIRKGIVSTDDLLKEARNQARMGDQTLLNRMNLDQMDSDYQAALLLGNKAKADRIWGRMLDQTEHFMQTIKGTGPEIVSRELTQAPSMGMGFGMGM